MVLLVTAAVAQSKSEPSADEVMARVGVYVAGYGNQTSLVVARETYFQNVMVEGAAPLRPRKLVAEFAIVRADAGWAGFRDVVEVNDAPVHDRRDRLASLLASASPTLSEAGRIANESARFNVGPVARNFNTPTTAMFFFLPQHLERFSFTRKGRKTIDRVPTVEIAFKETVSPTFVMTRAGKDVPIEGTLWVKPDDGTVVRTRIRLRRFSNQDVSPDLPLKPQERPPVVTTVPTGGERAIQIQDMNLQEQESSADVDVTYRRPAGIDIWLPAEMVEFYSGPIFVRNRSVVGSATTRATYSDFRQFSTTSKIVPQ